MTRLQLGSIAFGVLSSLLIHGNYAWAQKPLDKYTLVWELPTETTDGNPIDGDISVRLYQCDAPIADDKTCAGDMQVHDIPDPNALTSIITFKPVNKLIGDLYIRATAHFGDTRESALSNMVSVPFDVRTAPMPIVNLRAQ